MENSQNVETRTQLHAWNNTVRNYPLDRCLHELIETQAEHTPDTIAVTYEGQHLSYRELNRRANLLAHQLQQMGVGPDVLVGIYAERSLELVVGLLGILKAGGCYVPLDPDYPIDRIAFMLEDSKPAVLLSQSHLADRLPSSGRQILCLDRDIDFHNQLPDTSPSSSGLTPDHLAYTIYTSGSTGKPKGAMNIHKAICNRLLWMQEAYGLTDSDRVLQKTPHSFDVSVWEFFWPLMTGARLVVARPGGHRDRDYLIETIAREQITTMHFVPSMLALFLESNDVSRCTSLKRVFCSGEALPYEIQQRFFERYPNAELHNLYGPTEAAVDVTFWACRRDDVRGPVPIGRPIANIQMHILDERLEPVTVGGTGELYIGGIGLARGYLNRPELTTERFIPDPFSSVPGARLYRTGDLGRYRPDGAIEYLGRNDHQVKIRGNRIELGEIESVLCQHPAVMSAVVVAREDSPGDRKLVAYVVARAGITATVGDLRDRIKAQLPDYMVPAHFVMLDEIPLSLNGKVDRSALPPPPLERELDEDFAAPRTPIEAELARIWAKLLKVDRVGIHDDFIDAGGNSITVTQLASRAAERYDVSLSLGGVFDTPTIAGLARHIETLLRQQVDSTT